MENKILLSICIPTYNQPAAVERTLNSFVNQLTPETEVVISDDGPTDEVSKIIKERFPSAPIRYFRNQERFGSDGNLVAVTRRAQGKYVWWFGDDLMLPGAVSSVLKVVKETPETSLIWVKYIVEGEPVVEFKGASEGTFKSKDEMLRDAANRLGFFSAIVISREKLSTVQWDSEEFQQAKKTYFVNLYMVFHVLSQTGKFYFFNKPYVVCVPTPSDRHTNYQGFQAFAINFYKILKIFWKNFDRDSANKMLAKNFGHVWRGITVDWARGSEKTPRKKFLQLIKMYWNFREAIFLIPLLVMPRFLVILFYRAYKKFVPNTYGN